MLNKFVKIVDISNWIYNYGKHMLNILYLIINKYYLPVTIW